MASCHGPLCLTVAAKPVPPTGTPVDSAARAAVIGQHSLENQEVGRLCQTEIVACWNEGGAAFVANHYHLNESSRQAFSARRREVRRRIGSACLAQGFAAAPAHGSIERRDRNGDAGESAPGGRGRPADAAGPPRNVPSEPRRKTPDRRGSPAAQARPDCPTRTGRGPVHPVLPQLTPLRSRRSATSLSAAPSGWSDRPPDPAKPRLHARSSGHPVGERAAARGYSRSSAICRCILAISKLSAAPLV